jgi:diacylglycerol kinase family enzyme
MRTELFSDPRTPAREPAPRRLSVVLNPGAGKHDAQQTRELLSKAFTESGCRFDFVPVDSPEALEHASRKAALEAAQSGAVLVAVGGDGTINTVAEAAWRAGCMLAVVPQGTFNYFGRSHGIPQDADAAARALARGQVQPVQVGEVNGRLFLVNASVGLYPKLLEDRESFKRQLGRQRWVAIVSGLVTLFEWRRQLRIDVELDGEHTLLTTPTLFIGNNKLQLDRIGIDPAVAGRVGEGRLAAVTTRPVSTWRMLVLALQGALGRLGEAQQVQSFRFRTVSVRVLGMRRVKVAVDGEVCMMTAPLRFAVSDLPLQLVLPRPEDRVAVE